MKMERKGIATSGGLNTKARTLAQSVTSREMLLEYLDKAMAHYEGDFSHDDYNVALAELARLDMSASAITMKHNSDVVSIFHYVDMVKSGHDDEFLDKELGNEARFEYIDNVPLLHKNPQLARGFKYDYAQAMKSVYEGIGDTKSVYDYTQSSTLTPLDDIPTTRDSFTSAMKSRGLEGEYQALGVISPRGSSPVVLARVVDKVYDEDGEIVEDYTPFPDEPYSRMESSIHVFSMDGEDLTPQSHFGKANHYDFAQYPSGEMGSIFQASGLDYHDTISTDDIRHEAWKKLKAQWKCLPQSEKEYQAFMYTTHSVKR